jgi:Cof subfamily protein (haloacid dehalogenase superfamily)
MYKAVFIDMDGTLLKSDHSVSEANRQAIHHLQQKGVLVVPISARPLHGMMHIIKNVVAGDAPLVSLNGGYIVHKDEVIFQDAVSLHQVASVHKELSAYDVSAMYYSQMEWFAEQETDRIKKEQKITDVKIKIQPFAETLQYWDEQKNGPNKILIAGEKHLVHDIEQRLVALHGGELNIFKSQATYLEVMSNAASKAKAVEFLMNRYGIGQNEIIAIGDNFNDQGMIEFAGMGVAMGNAPEQIKAVANYVTDTNNNDGVAKALHYCFN